ncbi:MAG TPA: trehalose utilization protein [Planctomycetaceae bacterium]|nr:trehalose utilization protein [Blastopirellula sp.]HAY78175.1 trehalose utilization protein [Planctomycetaceae bacterium]
MKSVLGLLCLLSTLLCVSHTYGDPARPAGNIRVVIWDEQQPAQKKAYPVFLGQYIADYLKRQPGLKVNSVSIDHPQKGISAEVLDACDVLVWWGHVRNGDISEAEAQPILDRLQAGKLSLLALHSAHWATPFVVAMQARAKTDAAAQLRKKGHQKFQFTFDGKLIRRPPRRDAPLTPRILSVEKKPGGTTAVTLAQPNCCFPAYRNDGKPSTMHTLLADHPIAQGIPATFTLPHTEMYDEPFHVPAPDATVFDERWATGEHFRSGMIWQVGKGKVVYFRPGHETHRVYTEPLPMKIVENTIRWLAPSNKASASK